MAPPRLYDVPIVQLVRLLQDARERGLSFEQAWEETVRPGRSVVMTNTRAAPDGCVRWPTDSSDRIAWQGAIFGIKDQLRRAYQLRPATRRERAAALLVNVLLDAADRREAIRGIAPRGAVRSAA